MATTPANTRPPSPAATLPASPLLGYALGALGAAFFATKGIVIKLALLENVDAVTTLTWRMIISVPIFVIVGALGVRGQHRAGKSAGMTPATLLKAAGLGLLGYFVASYCDFVGLMFISAQFDRLILMTYPIFVVLLGAMFFGRKLNPRMLVWLGISYFGLVLIFVRDLTLDGQNVVIGAAFVMVSAISYALYQLLAKPVIDALGARLFTSVAMSAAGLAIVIVFALSHPLSDLAVSPKAMWLMLAMGTVSTVLPAFMISAAIGMVGAGPTAVLGNVSPLVTITMAVFVLGEAFSLWHAAGAALVLLGVIAFTRADRQAAAAAAAGRLPPTK